MAAIALRISLLCLAICLASAEQPKGIRQQIGYVATALTSGDAADAMTPFDRKFANYDKLRDYFAGLAGAFQLVNEIEVGDEEATATTAKLIVHWTLTMTDGANGFNNSRSGDLSFALALIDGRWKITDLTPIEFFDPQLRGRGKERSK